MVQVSRPDSKNSTRKCMMLERYFFHYFWHGVLIVHVRCRRVRIRSDSVPIHVCTPFGFNFLEYELQGLPEQREYWKTVVDICIIIKSMENVISQIVKLASPTYQGPFSDSNAFKVNFWILCFSINFCKNVRVYVSENGSVWTECIFR